MYLPRTVLSGGPRLRVPMDRSVGHTPVTTRGRCLPAGVAFETFSAGDPVQWGDEV
jgi:non-ribosomal peptide synthetase component F